MNNKYIVVILLCAVSILSGCSRNISRLKPYNEYVGQEVELKRPVILLERKFSHQTFWRQPRPLKSGELYEMVVNVESVGAPSPTTNKEIYSDPDYSLSKGTKLKIDKVISFTGLDWCEQVAFGNVYLQEMDRQVRFVYTLKNEINTNSSCISQAPWEDGSAQVLKWVGGCGQSYSDTMTCE